LVQINRAVTGNRAHGQFGIARHADFADEYDVNGGFQGRGNLTANNDTAARDGQYQYIIFCLYEFERLCEFLSGIMPVFVLFHYSCLYLRTACGGGDDGGDGIFT